MTEQRRKVTNSGTNVKWLTTPGGKVSLIRKKIIAEARIAANAVIQKMYASSATPAPNRRQSVPSAVQ